MNTPLVNKPDALDQAITACIRVFARRGREVRLQREFVSEQSSTVDTLPEIQPDSQEDTKEHG